MKKNIIDIKRELVDRLFAAIHKDYDELTIHMDGIGNIIPGANGVCVKRLAHHKFALSTEHKSVTTKYTYKLHIMNIIGEIYNWETEIAKFESLDPETRDKLGAFIYTKCDNAPAPHNEWNDMPTTRIGKMNYFTL